MNKCFKIKWKPDSRISKGLKKKSLTSLCSCYRCSLMRMHRIIAQSKRERSQSGKKKDLWGIVKRECSSSSLTSSGKMRKVRSKKGYLVSQLLRYQIQGGSTRQGVFLARSRGRDLGRALLDAALARRVPMVWAIKYFSTLKLSKSPIRRSLETACQFHPYR